jgi:hypothetical protein
MRENTPCRSCIHGHSRANRRESQERRQVDGPEDPGRQSEGPAQRPEARPAGEDRRARPAPVRYLSLDVQKDSIAIAAASSGGKPAESLGDVPNDVPALIKMLLRLGTAAALRSCYEAGPTDFGLARRLREAGIA